MASKSGKTVDLDNLKSLSMVILVPTFLMAGAIGGAFMLGIRMGRDDKVTHQAEGCPCGCADCATKKEADDNTLVIKGSTGNYQLVHTDGVTEMKKKNR